MLLLQAMVMLLLIFFDDFGITNLDSTKWDIINSGSGSISINDGILTIASNNDWWGSEDTSLSIVSKTAFNYNYVAEAFVVYIARDGYTRFFGLRSSPSTNARMFVLLPDSDETHITNVYRDADGVNANWYGENSGIPNPGLTNKIAKFERIGDTIKSYYNGQLTNQRTVSGWNLVYIGLTDTHGTADPNKFDWVRVRKYASPEPTTNVGSEETL